MPPTAPSPNAARLPPETALAHGLLQAGRLVAAVIRGRNLDVALAAAGLSATTRPAAMDLAYGTLRAGGRGDLILGKLLARPLKDPEVRGLLLVALHRLEEGPEDAHTLVDQAVDAAACLAAGRFKALVNGVLRNFLRQRDALLAAAAADPPARWRHPGWWSDRLRQDWPDQWPAILEAGNRHPPMSLRVNRRRDSEAACLARLEAAGINAKVIEGGAIRLERPLPVARLPGFAEGLLSVQDAGAQRAAGYLAPRPGMRVLDACAAPGGKTAHLLECADLDLLALDAEPARAARIEENLARLGLAATVKVADCRRTADWWDGRPFDRILADVPCSAAGVVRRHPDAKWLRRATDVAGFARVQAEILDALWPLLAPGGRMLYCTCSVFAAENRDQVAAFRRRHPDAIGIDLDAAGGAERALLPCDDHDGFYYALLEKQVR